MDKIIFGLPCSPSKLVSHKEQQCEEFVLSYGGGIGGSKRTIHATQTVYNEDKKEYCLDLINGEREFINLNFVVSRRQRKVVTLEFDTTAHANYHEKKYEKATCIAVYAMSILNTYEVIDRYLHDKPAGTELLFKRTSYVN